MSNLPCNQDNGIKKIHNNNDELAVINMAGREDAAKYYLNQHRIPELLHNLTSALVYDRPVDPKQYMIDFLKRLQDSKTTKMDYPNVFDESNIVSLFGIQDPSSQGSISYEKYKTAMESLGIVSFNRNPAGADVDKIPLDVFVNEAKQGLSDASATFAV